MRQILFFSTIISLAIITGCGTKPDQNSVEGPSVNSPIEVNKLSPNPSPAINSSQPITAPNISTPVNVPVQTQASTNTAGLNPAHGQPGHKCEIAVGAPLNSAATTTTTTTTSIAKPVNQSPVITTSAPTVTTTAATTPVKVAAGMNPAHGQPGHKCEIAVGAPLNSAPATTTTTTPSVTPTVNSNVTPGSISPSIINTTPTITTPTTTASTPAKVAPGMNPAHGQPGHKCEIAVGAPLNSAPDKKNN